MNAEKGLALVADAVHLGDDVAAFGRPFPWFGGLVAVRTQGLASLRSLQRVLSEVGSEEPASKLVPQGQRSLLSLSERDQSVLTVLTEHPLEGLRSLAAEGFLQDTHPLQVHGISSLLFRPRERGETGAGYLVFIGQGPVKLEAFTAAQSRRRRSNAEETCAVSDVPPEAPAGCPPRGPARA